MLHLVTGATQLLGEGQEVFTMAEASKPFAASGAMKTKALLAHWYFMPPHPVPVNLLDFMPLADLQVPPTSVVQPWGQYLLSFHRMRQ
jgi:hypothetical protein